MDLQEQRITCLRMAIEVGCKADSVVAVASDLRSFVTSGAAPSTVKSQPEEGSADATAACSPALPASETIDPARGQPETAPAAATCEPAAVADSSPAAVAVSEEPFPES